MINPNYSQDDLDSRIKVATSQAGNTCKTAESYLKGSTLSHLWILAQWGMGIMPSWAENHIKATKELEKVVAQYQRYGKEIPKDSIQKLKECREIVGSLSNKVDQLRLSELSN
jgi:hypothetical protein